MQGQAGLATALQRLTSPTSFQVWLLHQQRSDSRPSQPGPPNRGPTPPTTTSPLKVRVAARSIPTDCKWSVSPSERHPSEKQGPPTLVPCPVKNALPLHCMRTPSLVCSNPVILCTVAYRDVYSSTARLCMSYMSARCGNLVAGVGEGEPTLPSLAAPGQRIRLPGQTKVTTEEYKEFLGLGHGDIFDLDPDL